MNKIAATNCGFTLSEILLVLSVIGVVAAMTIPTVINKISKEQYVSKLKKEYSLLSQAYNMIISDAGGSILNNGNFNSATGDAATDANAMNEFATKLNVIKNCGNGTGCWYNSPLKLLSGTVNFSDNLENTWDGTLGKAILADGTSVRVDINNTSCTYNAGTAGTPLANSGCGAIYIDLNGASSPNTHGRDVFVFWLTQTGIFPLGTFGDGRSCDLNSVIYQTSQGCAGKVLSEGVMNY